MFYLAHVAYGNGDLSQPTRSLIKSNLGHFHIVSVDREIPHWIGDVRGWCFKIKPCRSIKPASGAQKPSTEELLQPLLPAATWWGHSQLDHGPSFLSSRPLPQRDVISENVMHFQSNLPVPSTLIRLPSPFSSHLVNIIIAFTWWSHFM